MLKATVTGTVWATRRIEKIPSGAFLEVEVDGGNRLVAFDVLGSGVGERVLIATVRSPSGWFGDAHAADRRADHRLDRRPPVTARPAHPPRADDRRRNMARTHWE